MKILKFPDPILLQSCEEVVSFDTDLMDMLDSMWKIMKRNSGLGLAANQVGIRLDMFVMETPEGRLNLINPYVSASSEEKANLEEGCLSAPGELIVVPGRSKWCQVMFQNENGEYMSAIFTGIFAVCAQHEIEHLDGKSFVEHKSIPKTARKLLQKKWGVKR
jgi:peptide deformylase